MPRVAARQGLALRAAASAPETPNESCPRRASGRSRRLARGRVAQGLAATARRLPAIGAGVRDRRSPSRALLHARKIGSAPARDPRFPKRRWRSAAAPDFAPACCSMSAPDRHCELAARVPNLSRVTGADSNRASRFARTLWQGPPAHFFATTATRVRRGRSVIAVRPRRDRAAAATVGGETLRGGERYPRPDRASLAAGRAHPRPRGRS